MKKEITLDDLCDELRPYVQVEPDGSWRLRPLENQPKHEGALKPQPPLTGYFYDREIELEYIRHNQEWARGEQPHPKFLFAYLNLATACELKCKGCYQGMDRKKPEVVHWKKSWLYDRLDEILDYLISRGGKSIAYAGQGELMTDPDAFELIERVRSKGLHFVVFTNGQALTDSKKAAWLDQNGVSIILSLRSTVETVHDHLVGKIGAFRKTLTSLSHFLIGNFRHETSFAMDLPITRNSKKYVSDFLKLARELNIVPIPEMYVVIGLSENELEEALTFEETDIFMEEMSALDRNLGFDTKTEWGQRIIGRDSCKRPWFTFTINHDMSVVSCPANSVLIGSLLESKLDDVFERNTKRLMDHFSNLSICTCSTFVNNNDVPISQLPLELRCLI